MRTSIGALGALLIVAFASPLAAQPAPPLPPLVKAENLRQVSPHIHVITDDSIPMVPNIGIIVGDKAVLVVDTGMGKRNGDIAAAAAKKLGGTKPVYLVTTHIHPEHDLGAHAFAPEVKMIRSTAQVKEIAETGLTTAESFQRMGPVQKELLEGATFRKADITYDKEFLLDLGGINARITALGPNHTAGDTVIWIAADRVLFAGDLAMNGMPAVAVGGNLNHWFGTLDTLEALKPAMIVPSHGPIGDAKYITTYRAYLGEVRDRTVAAKKQGLSVEQATEQVTTAIGTRYPTNRLAGSVAAAYREAP